MPSGVTPPRRSASCPPPAVARFDPGIGLNAGSVYGGNGPPLGYDGARRRLVRNEREAKLIRHIVQRFVELGASSALCKALKLDGVRSKAWTTQDGKTRDGKPID